MTSCNQLTQSPDFYSGPGASKVMKAKQIAATLGFDPNGVRDIESFKALANDAIRQEIGSLGAGVSNADVLFLSQANANLDFTPAGNQQLIATKRRLAERKVEVAKFARDYLKRTGKKYLDAQFDEELAAWSEANPMFPEAQGGEQPGQSGDLSPASWLRPAERRQRRRSDGTQSSDGRADHLGRPTVEAGEVDADSQFASSWFRPRRGALPSAALPPGFELDAPPAIEPQRPNIAHKGDRKPGDRIKPDLHASTMQGMMLAGADEFAAGATAPIMAFQNAVRGEGPTSIGENYDQQKAMLDAQLAATYEQYPTLAPVTEFAGAVVVPGGGSARAALKAPSLIGKMARGATTGAAFGGVHGFNSGDGLKDRLSRAQSGAQTGAIVGGAVPPVGQALGAGYRGVTRIFGGPQAGERLASVCTRRGSSDCRSRDRFTAHPACRAGLGEHARSRRPNAERLDAAG